MKRICEIIDPKVTTVPCPISQSRCDIGQYQQCHIVSSNLSLNIMTNNVSHHAVTKNKNSEPVSSGMHSAVCILMDYWIFDSVSKIWFWVLPFQFMFLIIPNPPPPQKKSHQLRDLLMPSKIFWLSSSAFPSPPHLPSTPSPDLPITWWNKKSVLRFQPDSSVMHFMCSSCWVLKFGPKTSLI